MAIPGYVPAADERDLGKLSRAIRNLSENAAAAPSTSEYPIGSVLMLLVASGSVANGSEVAGTSLRSYTINSSTGAITGVAAQIGTWLNVSGATLSSTQPAIGLFKRTA